MLMKEHKVVKTCPKGTKYTLVFDGVFRWTREGNLPIKLEGAFSSQIEAYEAFRFYCVSVTPEVSEVQGTESLEDLTKKADLVQWAEKQEIEIPAKLKQPAAIKKFLQEQVDA